jgi:hypothetical protein
MKTCEKTYYLNYFYSYYYYRAVTPEGLTHL